jgi:hypothetical protein
MRRKNENGAGGDTRATAGQETGATKDLFDGRSEQAFRGADQAEGFYS